MIVKTEHTVIFDPVKEGHLMSEFKRTHSGWQEFISTTSVAYLRPRNRSYGINTIEEAHAVWKAEQIE